MQTDSAGMEPLLAAAAQAAQANAEDVIDNLGDLLLVLNEELYVVSANRAFYDSLRVSQEETIHRHIFGGIAACYLGSVSEHVARLASVLIVRLFTASLTTNAIETSCYESNSR